MKTILLTGGAGFIGSHIITHALKSAAIGRVVCVDNLDPDSYSVALKKKNLALFSVNSKFVFYKTDIRNKKELQKIFAKERPTYVVHLAAKTDTRTSVLEPDKHAQVNVEGLVNTLECAREFGTKKFVFFSSSSVYGNDSTPPFAEKDATDFPLSPYAATKRGGELLAHTYYYNHGMPIAVFRIFNAYGPRLRPSLVLYRWVEKILAGEPIEMSGAGTRKRDFTYIGDIVKAVFLALQKHKGFEVFNIGSSRPASLTELLALVEKATGKKAIVQSRPSTRASVEATFANIAKAKKHLGWEPKMNLEKGVSEFVRWFRSDRLKNAKKTR